MTVSDTPLTPDNPLTPDTPLTPDSPFPCDRPVVRINRDRLWTNLMQLKEIGAYDDASTRLRGVRRLALTDEDAEGRAGRVVDA